MPIYEYGCPDCGERLERMQKISDPLLGVCPSCGSDKLRKLVSQTSFTLKGSGWYSDHYGLRAGGGEKAAPSAGEASPAAGAAPAGGAAPATGAASAGGGSGSSAGSGGSSSGGGTGSSVGTAS